MALPKSTPPNHLESKIYHLKNTYLPICTQLPSSDTKCKPNTIQRMMIDFEIKKISSALAILLEAHTSADQKYEALWIPFSMRLKSVFSIRCSMK